jgi:hypothetical protein
VLNEQVFFSFYAYKHMKIRYMPHFYVVFRYLYLRTDWMTPMPIEIACVLNVFLARLLIYVLHDAAFLPSLSHIFALVTETD